MLSNIGEKAMMITDYDVKNNPSKAVKTLHEAVDMFEKEMNNLQTAADTNTGKIQKIKQCGSMNGVMCAIASYDRTTSVFDSAPTCETVCKKAMEDADKRLAESREIHEANIPLIESNIKLRQQIQLIMRNAGIPSSYNESFYKSTRSHSLSYREIQSGWTQDLNRYVLINDNWEAEQKAYENFKRKVEEYRKQETAKEQAKIQEKEMAEKKLVEQRELAVFVVKYGLAPASTWENLLEHIVTKNKYLRLAHYLSLNRGDWNDGCDYAETGISGFTIETDIDREISDNINSCMGENWDGDGRVFRDCEWNYDRIFGLVTDSDLLKDYHVINSHISY